ncbi:MAG: hypothetical protein KME09_14350 [Pleurocapsa minor HA4230-MV1]|jgi:hypothetical protein|nr:hypothetical protein [Pleurocapsa minor HA4230-MV1]
MIFSFPSAIQAGMAAGKYAQVLTSTGVPIGMARDAVTGRFVSHAVGMSINPLMSPVSPILNGMQMYQTHQGFKAIQSTLGVLQASTAVIGVGTALGVGLTAVNLWQTMKLKNEVKQLKLEVKDGFLDLKAALKDHGIEIMEHIDCVAENIKFQQHRLELIKAHGRFIEATKLIQTAMKFQDTSSRKIELANARQTLGEAVANYNNPDLLLETSAAGKIRRLECAWAIEQAIILTYQLQNELVAVSDRLIYLQDKIRQECLQVIESCDSQDQLDFLFPEIACICDRDLLILNTWQHQAEYINALPASELELLALPQANTVNLEDSEGELIIIEKPIELTQYEDLQEKSHYLSLVDQLKFKVSPDLRKQHEIYVSNRAAASGHNILTKNIAIASDLSVANLYWYFQTKEECESKLEVVC